MLALTSERPVDVSENEKILADGSERWFQWTNRGLFDAEGRRCRSLIAGGNASSSSDVADGPAGSVVLSAVGMVPPHVGVQDAGAPM